VITKTDFVQSVPPCLAWPEKLRNALIDLLFPPHCVACSRPGNWLCANCLSDVQVIRPPVCRRCGLPADLPHTSGGEPYFCGPCQEKPPQLDGLIAYAFHSGPLREAIHHFKYEDLRSLAGPLGRLMSEGWESLAPQEQAVDAIVPVPLHPARQRQRGYNQASLLAREVGAHLQIPVIDNVLIRTKATTPQVGLGIQERRANVQDAFRCSVDDLSGKQVMLLDDVCTTGATLQSACAALQQAGTLSVWAYTLARAMPGLHEGVGPS
jgi:ComF family protein